MRCLQTIKICSEVLLLFLFVVPVLAQAPDTMWTGVYGGISSEAATCVCETPDGGFLLAGYTDSPPASGYDIYLARLTITGDTLWTRDIGGGGNDFVRSVRCTSDGGIILAAASTSFGHMSSDIWLVKLNASGDTLWTRWFGGDGYDDAADIKVLGDNGFIIAGYSAAPSSPSKGFAIRTNANGDTLWTRRYGGTGEQQLRSVEVLPDGGFVFAGYSTLAGGNGSDMFVVRANNVGDTVWTRLIGDSAIMDQAVGAEPMADGGFLIGGFTYNTPSGQADAEAVSLSSTGEIRWTRNYGGADWDRPYVLRRTHDGHFVLGGITHSYGAGNYDFWMVCITSNGDTTWTKTMGGAGNEFMYNLETVRDGGYIAVGFTNSWGLGNTDCYAVRLKGFSGVGGIVHDASTGLPLANVRVSTSGHWRTALTDAAGHYVLIMPPDTTMDIFTDGPCTEYDTVRNVTIIPDSIVDVSFTVGHPAGYVVESSLNFVVPNHRTDSEPLTIINTGIATLGFNIDVQTTNPRSAWMSVDPAQGSVPPGDTLQVSVHVAPDTSGTGVYDYDGVLSVHLNACPDTLALVPVLLMVLNSDDRRELQPLSFSLSAFPNPFNPSTTLSFSLPRSGLVSLNIYDITGREVQTVLKNVFSSGIHQVRFDATDLPSGLYFARLQIATATLTKKLMLIR